ncbi:MAG: hypothetical protein AAFR28_03565 [Pseudomonadota bacterium]
MAEVKLKLPGVGPLVRSAIRVALAIALAGATVWVCRQMFGLTAPLTGVNWPGALEGYLLLGLLWYWLKDDVRNLLGQII